MYQSVLKFLKTFHSEEVVKIFDFSQESWSSLQNIFLESTLEAESFESVSFSFPEIKDIKTIDFSVSHQTISTVSQPIPILVIPPQRFVF